MNNVKNPMRVVKEAKKMARHKVQTEKEPVILVSYDYEDTENFTAAEIINRNLCFCPKNEVENETGEKCSRCGGKR